MPKGGEVRRRCQSPAAEQRNFEKRAITRAQRAARGVATVKITTDVDARLALIRDLEDETTSDGPSHKETVRTRTGQRRF
jgi:hypothetical protein